MTNSIDKIVDGFPHPNIAPIVGIPTYESIAELNLQLNANAASVQSNLGNGQLGLLALTVSPTVFNTLSAVAFVHPVNPGTNPVIPPGATTHVTSHLTRVFATQKAIFREYHATDNALKQQVIGCVDGMGCTCELSVTESQDMPMSQRVNFSCTCTPLTVVSALPTSSRTMPR